MHDEHNIDILDCDIHDAVRDVHDTIEMIFHIYLKDGNKFGRMYGKYSVVCKIYMNSTQISPVDTE